MMNNFLRGGGVSRTLEDAEDGVVVASSSTPSPEDNNKEATLGETEQEQIKPTETLTIPDAISSTYSNSSRSNATLVIPSLDGDSSNTHQTLPDASLSSVTNTDITTINATILSNETIAPLSSGGVDQDTTTPAAIHSNTTTSTTAIDSALPANSTSPQEKQEPEIDGEGNHPPPQEHQPQEGTTNTHQQEDNSSSAKNDRPPPLDSDKKDTAATADDDFLEFDDLNNENANLDDQFAMDDVMFKDTLLQKGLDKSLGPDTVSLEDQTTHDRPSIHPEYYVPEDQARAPTTGILLLVLGGFVYLLHKRQFFRGGLHQHKNSYQRLPRLPNDGKQH